MSSNKLHPIYVALDNHQYSRAVKLASSLPPSNVLGQALLAHALWKSGDSLSGLKCIKEILWFDSVELDYEIQRLELSKNASDEQLSVAAAATPTRTKSKTIGGKGKKSGKSKGATATVTQVASAEHSQMDLIDYLTTPLVLPDGWDKVTKKPDKEVITHETTLDTLAVTLQGLRLYTTAYQLYAMSTPPTAETLLKSYTSGLYILAFSSKYDDSMIAATLASMQVTALQFARGGEEHDGLKLWSAQTALWQLKYIDAESIQDDKTRQRLQMLPRLAESISQKYSQSSVEATLLHVSVLQQQEKYTEILETLNNINDDSLLTTQQKCELVAMAYEKQKEWESAQLVYQKLLQEHPAQWMYWKRLVENAFRQDGIKYASETIHTLLNIIKDESNKYPVRAHHLILCELAAVQIRGLDNGEDDSVIVEDDTETLQRAIVDYGNTFGPRASCAYSDLAKYIELLATKNASSHETLLEWASRMLVENHSAADRSMLRSYVFAIQVIYKVVTMSKDEKAIEKWLPAWEDLVVVWRNSQKMGTATAGDDVQKENQPGDELILLAVQNVLFRNDNEICQLLSAAVLLEEALQYSPYNAYLKIAGIDVYARLNATRRAWELFQDLSIKHIQLDSCSYIIFSKLVNGGMYNEAIQVAKEVLKFHNSTARNTGDFTGQAMEQGTLSKANEFLEFQRDRMDPSLTLLEAKGCIMDCAPLLFLQTKTQAIGMQHGIVGEETDLERLVDMVREAHNTFGAPNIMTIATAKVDPCSFSDNRDDSILSYQILSKPTLLSKEELVQDFVRCGLLHRLLVPIVLCLDVSKGPKKGKVTKASDLLKKGCASLLHAIDETVLYMDNAKLPLGSKEFIEGMLSLCRVVAFVSAGMPGSEEQDSLASREQFATNQLESIVIPESTDWSVPEVCRFLPCLLVPYFVILRMTANLFASYGWGKRKCHTRASAGAMAKVASKLKATVEAMCIELNCLPESDDDCTSKKNEYISLLADNECLNKETVENVCSSVTSSQQLTKQRVMPFLDAIVIELSSFEVEES